MKPGVKAISAASNRFIVDEVSANRLIFRQPNEMQIYVTQNGQRVGPFLLEEINRQLAAGTLNPSDQAWSEGSPGWKPLLSFAGVIVPGGASSTAEPVGIATPIVVAPPRYGGFWIRVVAYIVDCVILVVPIGIVQLLLRANADNPASGQSGLAAIIAILIEFVYFAALWSSSIQASLGQKLFGLRVIRVSDGGKISFLRGLVRVFGMVLSGVTFCIGYLMVALTERKQGLHDMLAATYVVKDR